jgi:hypothetical protein
LTTEETVLLNRATSLNAVFEQPWSEEAIEALAREEEAIIGFSIARGVANGWINLPLPDDALNCLDQADTFASTWLTSNNGGA